MGSFLQRLKTIRGDQLSPAIIPDYLASRTLAKNHCYAVIVNQIEIDEEGKRCDEHEEGETG
jgi:hypothetical protein